eukprot:365555-Chlamydomonas_euryale.AAC.9
MQHVRQNGMTLHRASSSYPEPARHTLVTVLSRSALLRPQNVCMLLRRGTRERRIVRSKPWAHSSDHHLNTDATRQRCGRRYGVPVSAHPSPRCLTCHGHARTARPTPHLLSEACVHRNFSYIMLKAGIRWFMTVFVTIGYEW